MNDQSTDHHHRERGQVHVHSGMSSDPFIDAETVLDRIGVRPGERVLDLGCGNGHLSVAAARRVGKKGHVYALDSYQPALEELEDRLARDGVGNVTGVHADATAPFPATVPRGSIDLVLIVNVLHGFVLNGELDAVLSALAPHLAPTARLAVIEFKPDPAIPGPAPDERLDPDAVEKHLAPEYHLQTEFEGGPYSYGLLFSFTKRTD